MNKVLCVLVLLALGFSTMQFAYAHTPIPVECVVSGCTGDPEIPSN